MYGTAADLPETAVERLSLSACAYDRILKGARTIADLPAHDAIAPEYVAAALQVVLTTARATLHPSPTAPRC